MNCSVGCTPITNCMASTTPACSGDCGSVWSLYNLVDNPEHTLMSNHLCEVADVVGFPVEYRVLLSNYDYLFGEDPNEKLSEPILTKVVYNPEEETAILDMFGITGDQTLQYMFIPISTFDRDMMDDYYRMFGTNVIVKPKVGDVITVLAFNRSYEITNVSQEQTIFLGKKFTYAIILRPFRFSEQSDEHREVHTGLDDGVPDPFSTIINMPDGSTMVEKQYSVEKFGDNNNLETESNTNYDYSLENDPDYFAFQSKG